MQARGQYTFDFRRRHSSQALLIYFRFDALPGGALGSKAGEDRISKDIIAGGSNAAATARELSNGPGTLWANITSSASKIRTCFKARPGSPRLVFSLGTRGGNS